MGKLIERIQEITY